MLPMFLQAIVSDIAADINLALHKASGTLVVSRLDALLAHTAFNGAIAAQGALSSALITSVATLKAVANLCAPWYALWGRRRSMSGLIKNAISKLASAWGLKGQAGAVDNSCR